MREGEPRVWRELIAASDAKFGLASGELRPNVNKRRYGSLFGTHTWSTLPLDYAISGECHLCTRGEERWLKDCLNHYDAMIDSLDKLHDTRECMVTEGPRWRLTSDSV